MWTNLRRYLLLPAAPLQLKFLCPALAKAVFAFVLIICGPLWLTYLLPQVFDVLKHIFVKHIGNISGVALDISLLNISAIYRDWLHSLGTRSADEFLKVSSTTTYTRASIQVRLCPRVDVANKLDCRFDRIGCGIFWLMCVVGWCRQYRPACAPENYELSPLSWNISPFLSISGLLILISTNSDGNREIVVMSFEFHVKYEKQEVHCSLSDNGFLDLRNFSL